MLLKVINGAHEPSGSELEWQSETEDDDAVALALHPDYPKGVKGIPKFWLHVFKNANEEVLMGLLGRTLSIVIYCYPCSSRASRRRSLILHDRCNRVAKD